MADLPAERPGHVPTALERVASWGWRLVVLAVVGLGILWVLGKVWVALLAFVVALFLTRALDGPSRWLRGRGLPPALVAAVCLLGFLGAIGLLGWLLIPAIADEVEGLGPTLTEAVDDVEEWLVEDAPGDLDQRDIERFRDRFGNSFGESLSSSSSSITRGALTAIEVVTGLLLALVTTFFFLKDGRHLQSVALDRLPAERRDLACRMAARAWATLGGYLRGAATLGVVEAVTIGIALLLAGGSLVVPVMVLTFAAAFVPFVGAIVAGVVAVLVALATGGVTAAIIVAIVAVVVQQLDSDFLAPVVYGRALALHPLVVLFSIVIGGALFGFAGTLLAVPVTAVALNLSSEAGIGRVDEPSGETEADREGSSL